MVFFGNFNLSCCVISMFGEHSSSRHVDEFQDRRVVFLRGVHIVRHTLHKLDLELPQSVDVDGVEDVEGNDEGCDDVDEEG